MPMWPMSPKLSSVWWICLREASVPSTHRSRAGWCRDRKRSSRSCSHRNVPQHRSVGPAGSGCVFALILGTVENGRRPHEIRHGGPSCFHKEKNNENTTDDEVYSWRRDRCGSHLLLRFVE